MPDIFDQIDVEAKGGDIFDQIPLPKESLGKNLVRTAYQPLSGFLKKYTWPADVIQMAGVGEALDPEFIEHLKKIHEREGIPFDEEEYVDKVAQAAGAFPTQTNIERGIEEKTGIPLQARTGLQKTLQLGSTAAAFTPGGLLQKGTAAIATPILKETGMQAGLPESVAELGALGVGGLAGSKVPFELDISKSLKPSGLTARQFEKIVEPKTISPGKFQKINEKLENDFRKISDSIISTSPIEKTKTELKINSNFKSQVADQFKEVENLAESIPNKISGQKLKDSLVRSLKEKKTKGFVPSEYEKNYQKFLGQLIKDTPKEDIIPRQLVQQYRKNNRTLAEAYDPGRSYAFNKAKKDAILEHNRSIANLIEKEFPDSEFSNLFKNTNKQWSEISDLEAINKFVDGIFDGKIKYEKAKKFFENDNIARPFKKALGEKGFKDFEQLMKDLLSSETPYKMLKVAKTKGFGDLFQTASAYLIHPTIGKAATFYKAGKNVFKFTMNSLLDKPQLAITWKRGIDNLKKGRFASAQKDFEELKEQSLSD